MYNYISILIARSYKLFIFYPFIWSSNINRIIVINPILFYSLCIINMKTTTINWINFTFKKFNPIKNWKSEIHDLYWNPSYNKIRIFNEWDWKLDLIYWLTWNFHNFSIYGSIKDNDWKFHNVKITKSYNYILD